MAHVLDTPQQGEGKLLYASVVFDITITQRKVSLPILGTDDCGVAVCLICDFDSRDLPLSMVKAEDITSYRRYIAISIIKGTPQKT